MFYYKNYFKALYSADTEAIKKWECSYLQELHGIISASVHFFYRAALTLLVFQVYTFQIRNEPVYPQDKVENLNNFLDVLLEHQTNFQKAINSTGCLEEVSQTFMNHVRIGKKVKNNFWSDNKRFSRSCSIVTSRFWI